MLQILDAHWREHLAALDHLRQGIHLRGYAQKNPKQEYKREAFELFGAMVEAVKLEVTKTLTAVQIRTQEDIKPDDAAARRERAPACTRAPTAAPSRSRRQRRRRGRRGAEEAADRALGAEGRAQRSLPLRLGQEIQALPRQAYLGRRVMAVNLPPPDPDALHPVAGVELGVAMAGIKKPGRKDLLVMRLAPGAAVAGVFTQNRFCAAPVLLCRKHLKNEIRALVVNTGNANAGTGEDGLKRALQVCEALAGHLGCKPQRGAAVLDRRDHGAAAGGAHRRRAAESAAGEERLAVGGRGDHDDRHGAEGLLARR